MNDENRVVRVEQVDDLEVSSSPPPTHDQQLFIADLLRKGRPGLPDNHFGFRRIHPVLRNVVPIPVDPAKLHGPLRRLGPYAVAAPFNSAFHAGFFAAAS